MVGHWRSVDVARRTRGRVVRGVRSVWCRGCEGGGGTIASCVTRTGGNMAGTITIKWRRPRPHALLRLLRLLRLLPLAPPMSNGTRSDRLRRHRSRHRRPRRLFATAAGRTSPSCACSAVVVLEPLAVAGHFIGAHLDRKQCLRAKRVVARGMGASPKPSRAAWCRAGARFTPGRALIFGQMALPSMRASLVRSSASNAVCRRARAR